MTHYLTDEQMRKLSRKTKEVFPWTCRENTIYKAELISIWKVEFKNEQDAHLLLEENK